MVPILPPAPGMTKRKDSTVHPEVADHAASDPAKEDTILPCQSLTDNSSETTTYHTIESCCTHLGNSPEHPLNGCPPSHELYLCGIFFLRIYFCLLSTQVIQQVISRDRPSSNFSNSHSQTPHGNSASV